MTDFIKDLQLPDSVLSTVKRSEFRVIENADISDDEDLRHLIELMFNFPECAFYVYLQRDASLTQPLREAMDGKVFNCTQTDLEFFRHPNFHCDFVKVRRGQERFDWQREVTANGKEFVRFTIVLSEWKRRKLEVEQHLEAHAQRSSNPIEMKPGFAGFSIDLKKLWKLAKAKLRR
ncbi:hypothetical protein LJR084_002472 [Variovorax sp. LjRoot84]|uniref:hypothetical protein n=1 Tax=Variovorax sp. LjRoot84 TaxID=3342340 RepID=UPI003ECEB458